MSSSRLTDADKLHIVETAFDEAFKQEPAAKEELLRDLGYNPQQVMERGMWRIQEIRAKQRLTMAAQLWAKFTDVVKRHSATFEAPGGIELRQAVEGILTVGGNRQQVVTAFRDLKFMEDHDLQVILNDAGLLDQLEAFWDL